MCIAKLWRCWSPIVLYMSVHPFVCQQFFVSTNFLQFILDWKEILHSWVSSFKTCQWIKMIFMSMITYICLSPPGYSTCGLHIIHMCRILQCVNDGPLVFVCNYYYFSKCYIITSCIGGVVVSVLASMR